MRDIVAKGDNIPLGRQGENRCTRVTLPRIRWMRKPKFF